MGIQGADRAIAVCDSLRGVLPTLLAVSANSPFLDRRDTGLHSVRTEIFTRAFPRCGVHEPFGDWATYAEFVELLARTRSVVESTQLWWSVRPHHLFGTVEVRICDAQSRGEESFGLAALIAACIAQTALDHDDGRLAEPMGQREIEENLWRAIRYGMDGKMIDFATASEIEAAAVVERAAVVDRAGARGARARRRASRSSTALNARFARASRGSRSSRSTAKRSPKRAAPTSPRGSWVRLTR